MMNIVSTASDLSQDFKTGYLTIASPRAIFVSQIIGTANHLPLCLMAFLQTFDDLGLPGSEYAAPFAIVNRNMAKLSIEGFSALPKDCLLLCCVFFGAAVVINLIRDPHVRLRRTFLFQWLWLYPFTWDHTSALTCVGSLILFIWSKIDNVKLDNFGPAMASGLMGGDGIWPLPSSLLALEGIKPPICMKFLSRKTNSRVDKL